MLNAWKRILLLAVVAAVMGCGGIRYSQVSPEAGDFHPRRIAVLPADGTAFPEAKADIDRLFGEVLSERKWFDGVIGGDAVSRRMASDEGFRQAVTEYLAKLANVNFSDPALSARVGELTGAEGFLLVRIDYWNHTTENDKKVGKVSLTVRLVEAKTGKILWTAFHHRISDYLIIKPDLPDVARDLIREMVGHMPR